MNTEYLTALKDNEKGRIHKIDRCGNARKRLYELGLCKDTEIKMVKNDKGPVIISVSGCKLALGRNLADHIQVAK